jgi:NAD(P)-dependent dehydrogenase (short-subunit alcohol dehydrogenase family)
LLSEHAGDFPEPARALVIGGSGGIGAALVRGLTARGVTVTALSRNAPNPDQRIDITHEAGVEAAAARLREEAPFATIAVATGLLHDAGASPERALRDLQREKLERSFLVNAIGPALVAKHFAPLLPTEDRGVFAALSARVGSISDNRIGGWYGYRASKAALNMLVRTAAIEIARKRPQAIVVTLHPGTVDTALSAPFQRGVPAGKLFTPDQSAGYLLDVIDRLEPGDSGKCFAWDGKEILP